MRHRKKMILQTAAITAIYLIGIVLILGSGPPRRRSRPIRYYNHRLTFQVNSEPQGATVLLDNEPQGETPVTVSLPYTSQSRGYHDDVTRTRQLKLIKTGYQPATYSFSIKGREYKRLPNPIRLEQLLAETVSITGSAGLLKRVTTGGPGEKVCDLSPDKQWLLIEVFETGPKASHHHVLQKINLSTRAKVLLSPKGSDSRQAVWHPDGNSFIFVSNRLGERTIVQSLGTAGEVGVRFITQPSLGTARLPSVSPGGNDIAFCIGSSLSNQTLAIIHRDGSNLRMFDYGREPKWSPDAKTLLFVRKVGEHNRIFSMDAQTGTNLIELSSTACNDTNPEWAPNGNHIAFLSDRVNGRKHLYIMNRNGQNITQLTDGVFDISSLLWGKDGFIYFSANAGGNWDIWRLKPMGF